MRFYFSRVGVGAILFFMGGRRGWMFMYDEFEDELEENHDNGAEILVVSNLDARIELEFSMYETYKVTDLEKMRSLQR